jgi:hypothetical protein
MTRWTDKPAAMFAKGRTALLLVLAAWLPSLLWSAPTVLIAPADSGGMMLSQADAHRQDLVRLLTATGIEAEDAALGEGTGTSPGTWAALARTRGLHGALLTSFHHSMSTQVASVSCTVVGCDGTVLFSAFEEARGNPTTVKFLVKKVGDQLKAEAPEIARKLAAQVAPTPKPTTPPPTATAVQAAQMPASRPPEVRILFPRPGDVVTTEVVSIVYQVIGCPEDPKIRFSVNGNPVGKDRALGRAQQEHPDMPASISRDARQQDLPLEIGQWNHIGVYVSRGEGQPEGSDTVSVYRAPAPEPLLTQLHDYYPQLHVLAIGINDYKCPAIDDLQYAERDAEDFALLMLARFHAGNVRILRGDMATRDGLTDAIAALFDRATSENDALVVFFAGHGQTVPVPTGGDMGFLIPQDAVIDLRKTENSQDYYRTCIPMERINREWRPLIKARHVAFITDACYSGLIASRGSQARGDVEQCLKLPVTYVLTAGNKDEKSQEDPLVGHGSFSYRLLQALETGAADVDGDGYIRMSELGEYLADKVKGQSPQSRVLDGEGDLVLLRP